MSTKWICDNCGKLWLEDLKKCNQCGQVRGQRVAEDATAGERYKYTGVEGWLLILCIFLTVVTPLSFLFFQYRTGMNLHGRFALSQIFVTPGNTIPGWSVYHMVSGLLDVGILIFGIEDVPSVVGTWQAPRKRWRLPGTPIAC